MECEDDEEMEDDIYLRVLKYIREVDTKDKKKTDEEMVPPQFHVYLDVFKKAPSERLPLFTLVQTMGSCDRSESQLHTLKVYIIPNVSNGTTGSQGLH